MAAVFLSRVLGVRGWNRGSGMRSATAITLACALSLVVTIQTERDGLAQEALSPSDLAFPSIEVEPDPNELELLPPIEVESEAAPRATMVDDSSRAPFRTRLSWLPASTLKSGAGSVMLQDSQMDLAFPLRFESDGIWLGMLGLQSLAVDMDGVPANVAAPLPDRFWDLELGVMRIKQWEGGNQSGAMIRVGSPSDQPYSALRDMTVSCLAFLRVPDGEHNAWEFSLFYSPTGQVVFPLPGLAYRWNPDETLQVQIGVPASFTYRPTDDWLFRGSYRPLNQVQLEAVRRVGESWEGFARFDTISEAFFQADRIADRERTYFFDQRLSLGVRRRLLRGWSLEAHAAYVFDRKIFDGESFSRDRHNVMSLDPTVGGGVSVVWER